MRNSTELQPFRKAPMLRLRIYGRRWPVLQGLALLPLLYLGYLGLFAILGAF